MGYGKLKNLLTTPAIKAEVLKYFQNSADISPADAQVFSQTLDAIPWQIIDIEKSFELIAAKEQGGVAPAPKESLADLATDAEVEDTSTFEDDEIPF